MEQELFLSISLLVCARYERPSFSREGCRFTLCRSTSFLYVNKNIHAVIPAYALSLRYLIRICNNQMLFLIQTWKPETILYVLACITHFNPVLISLPLVQMHNDYFFLLHTLSDCILNMQTPVTSDQQGQRLQADGTTSKLINLFCFSGIRNANTSGRGLHKHTAVSKRSAILQTQTSKFWHYLTTLSFMNVSITINYSLRLHLKQFQKIQIDYNQFNAYYSNKVYTDC